MGGKPLWRNIPNVSLPRFVLVTSQKTKGKTLYASIPRLLFSKKYVSFIFLEMIPFEEYISDKRSNVCSDQHVQINGKDNGKVG